MWVHFSGLKKISSVFLHKTQQWSFLYSRYSQYTQFLFRFSLLKFMSSDSRTWKLEFTFQNLKIWFQFSGHKIWGTHLEENQKTVEKFSKFPKLLKLFPKVCKRVLGQFFRQFFYPVFHGRSSLQKCSKNQKLFKNTKLRKIVPKSVQTCFGAIFFVNFFIQCSLEGRVFKNVPKIKKLSKLQKCAESFPKVAKSVSNMFWGFFRTKNFAQCCMVGLVFEKVQKNPTMEN